MKVYIISKLPFPYGFSSTKRVLCYAYALEKVGVNVEVLIYSRTEVAKEIPKNVNAQGVYNKIPYRYMGNTPLRTNNPLVNKVNDFIDKVKLFYFLKNNLNEGDIVLGYINYEVNFVNHLIKLIHSLGAKYVRELCEIPYLSTKENECSRKNREMIYKKQFPRCDGFIAISESLCKLVKSKVPNAPVVKIPIMVKFDDYDLEDLSEYSTIPYIFHSGSLYEQKDGIVGMLRAFGKAKQKYSSPLQFFLTGKLDSSPDKDRIQNVLKEYNIEKDVFFQGYLNEENLRIKLQHSTLVIINKYNNEQNQFCFSTKLAEYLAASKPLIITRVGEAMNWLEHNESAIIVEPHNFEKLSDAIVDLMSNKTKRFSIGQCGKNVCKNSFDFELYGDVLKSFFSTLSKNEKNN